MQTVLRFLLCFAIAFNGLAFARTLETPCPMMQIDDHQLAGDTADLGGCCNDADMAAQSGKLCKTGQQCSAPALGVTVRLARPSVNAALDLFSALPPPRIAAFDPASIWRPPSLS